MLTAVFPEYGAQAARDLTYGSVRVRRIENHRHQIVATPIPGAIKS